jgi:CelD/BcsL family acetyltransferase involved in cellulose biosynthesis
LKVDDKIVGYRYGFLYKQRFYDWNTSFDPAYFQYSPGKILVGEAIRSSIENRIEEFDFLRGDEEYKLKWTELSRAIYELFYFANSALGSILASYYGTLRPRIKSSKVFEFLVKS